MDGNYERNTDPLDDGRIIVVHGNQGNSIVSVLNSNHSTVKIDSLSIKLGIVKEKGVAPKCRHFSIRGYVAGMREKGSNDISPFAELPPMDIPKFRYWLCQRCLQNNGTEDDSNESKSVSVCDKCLVRPSIEIAVLPFGEGTSGVKSVDNRNNVDSSNSIVAALGADESQTLQEIPEKVKFSQEIPKNSSVDTNVVSPGNNENKGLRDHGDPVKICLLGQPPIESGQQDDCQNGHPRRKARKVRLLKELLCGNKNVESPEKQNEKSPPLADSNKIKRKLLHDRDHDIECVHDHRSVDSKKPKPFKGNTITRNVVKHSRNPEAREDEKMSSIQRNSILGNVGSDTTAWRTIFSDMGRTENRVPPSYVVPKGRGTEPYSNFMAPPKSNKKVNFSNKITKKPLKSKYLGEDLRRMKDHQSDRELGLGLSLNFDPQSQIQSSFKPDRTPNKDHSRKSSIFFQESDIHDVSNRGARITQFPYSSCPGHQKVDYSDITRPRNHQSQEKTSSIGRSDEREIIELLAKNQYERNLSEARSRFAPNGIKPNTSGQTSSSSHHGYINMVWPSTNVAPTAMRNSDGAFFHQDKVSSFPMFDSLTRNQKKPSTNGFWISDSGPQRHYESRYDHSIYHNPINMQVPDGYNQCSKAAQQHEASGQRFSQPLTQPYPKYSEKDKGKNMIDLDLNVVAPNAVDEQNNLESFRSLDSSYSNDAIPAMQLLSLMDAGKSSQPFNINSQSLATRTLSPCYSNCSSAMIERTNAMIKSHFPYSGLRPCIQNGQNVQLTSTQSYQAHHKFQAEKSKGLSSFSVNHVFKQEGNYIVPIPWLGTEDRNKLVYDGSFGNRVDSSKNEICVINRNPADFTTPGPENEFMINPQDLMFF